MTSTVGAITHLTCGIHVVTDVQSGEVEQPTVEGNSGRWLYWYDVPLHQFAEHDIAITPTSTNFGILDSISNGLRWEIDAKSKRKLSERDRVEFIVTNAAVAGGGPVNFMLGTRSLLMEPIGR